MIEEGILKRFVGRWLGTGHGEYPTLDSFDYSEELRIVATHTPDMLQYDQRTRRPDADGMVMPSHMELGFIRLRGDGKIEITNTQSGGRVEVLVGVIRIEGDTVVLELQQTVIGNDDRMGATARVFRLTGDTLRYQQDMALVGTDDVPLQCHTAATLQRIPSFMT